MEKKLKVILDVSLLYGPYTSCDVLFIYKSALYGFVLIFSSYVHIFYILLLLLWEHNGKRNECTTFVHLLLAASEVYSAAIH